jgi:hypothetical protein
MKSARSILTRFGIYLLGIFSLFYLTAWWWAALVCTYGFLYVALPQMLQVLANTREPPRLPLRPPLPVYDIFSYRHAVERKRS